jgi:hypothetical protein
MRLVSGTPEAGSSPDADWGAGVVDDFDFVGIAFLEGKIQPQREFRMLGRSQRSYYFGGPLVFKPSFIG